MSENQTTLLCLLSFFALRNRDAFHSAASALQLRMP